MLKESTLQTAELLNILPEEDISIVKTLIKKLIIAWDPDFTKVTPKEKEIIDKSEIEMENGEYITEKDFWKDLI